MGFRGSEVQILSLRPCYLRKASILCTSAGEHAQPLLQYSPDGDRASILRENGCRDRRRGADARRVVECAAQFACRSAVLDGEIIVQDERASRTSQHFAGQWP